MDPTAYPVSVSSRDNFGSSKPFTVAEDHFFVMGDNRDNSHDSRYFGPVSRKLIKGKAMIIYWSWDSEDDLPFYTGLTSLPRVVGSMLWSLPGRVRYGRLGDVIF